MSAQPTPTADTPTPLDTLDAAAAVAALAALAQPARLAVFRHLVQAGRRGDTPGRIAEALGLAPATLSHHLKTLAHAGLVDVEAQGRSLIYRTRIAHMQALLDYLTAHCCAGEAPCLPASTGCCP